MEIDTVGTAAAALAGSTLVQSQDPEEAKYVGDGHACADCGTPLSGKFCSECGQPAHVHRTLLHLGHELLHGVMHFDGRLWRTLPLLIGNPGRLTREWCEGRRSRYVSPLASFLFTLFIIFFGLTMMPPPNVNIGSSIEASALTQQDAQALRAKLVELDKEILEVEQAFEQSRGSDRISLGTRKGALAGARAGVQAQLETAERNEATKPSAETGRSDGLEPGSWQAQVADLRWENDGKGVMAKISKKLKNPDLMVYKLQQTAYKFSFLLIPLSIPFMWLLFLWRRGPTLYDHGVFVLYSLTFMAMLSLVAVSVAGLVPALGKAVAWITAFVVPAHMFMQLKGAYSLSIFSTLWRMVFLLVFCTIVLGLFLTAIVYLGLGH